jgi:hypothetical protein
MSSDEDAKLRGILPDFRTLFPSLVSVNHKFIKKKLNSLYQSDCFLILGKLSRFYLKHCQSCYGLNVDQEKYRERCLELLSPIAKHELFRREQMLGKNYDVIFPELSIAYLVRLCLNNCIQEGHSESEFFDQTICEAIGDCLLIANSILIDQQYGNAQLNNPAMEILVTNFTKQVIADKNFNVHQKLYQNYFIFNKFLPKYKAIFDIEAAFLKRYQVTIKEYSAFLFVIHAQYIIRPGISDVDEMPHTHSENGMDSLKDRYKNQLLVNLMMDKRNAKKIDESFFNITDISKRPLVKLDNGVVIPMSLKRLLVGLTDSVYFDLSDSLTDSKQKDALSNAFGLAVQDYGSEIVLNFDKKAIPEFSYGKSKKDTTDMISVQGQGVVFYEFKKRQFHTRDFLINGNADLFYKRIDEFFAQPLKQVCERIIDFRNGAYQLPEVKTDALIYPIVVCPSNPPLFSGAWDKLNFDERILPEIYKRDANIALPEFIDFAELEAIEAYLKDNPTLNIIDLIKIKRADQNYHNANWTLILNNNGMYFTNKRLFEAYYNEAKEFQTLLFK